MLRFNAGFLGARIGEWLYTLAINWLVLVETASPLLLAVINACRLLPSLVLSVPAGQMADRFERKRLNMLVGLANALLVALTGLAFFLDSSFSVIALLVILRAVVTAAEAPIRNAYLCGVMEGDRLKSAVAQNASIMNLGRVLGPTLAGFSLAYLGGIETFLLAAAFCALFPLALTTIHGAAPVLPASKKTRGRTLKSELKARPELSKLILFGLPVMFFGFPYTAMLPLFTEAVLHMGAEQLGALMSISAAGALVASSMLSIRPGDACWKLLRRYSLWFGAALTLLATTSGFAAAALALFAVGYFGQAYRTSSRMMFQDLVPKGAAGGLLGVALMDRGMIPLGGLMVGALAQFAGARLAFLLMGVGCVVSVVLFFRRYRFS